MKIIFFYKHEAVEKEEIKFARQMWHTNPQNASKAFALIERINCVEKFLLGGLSESNSNDYLGAFQHVCIFWYLIGL